MFCYTIVNKCVAFFFSSLLLLWQTFVASNQIEMQLRYVNNKIPRSTQHTIAIYDCCCCYSRICNFLRRKKKEICSHTCFFLLNNLKFRHVVFAKSVFILFFFFFFFLYSLFGLAEPMLLQKSRTMFQIEYVTRKEWVNQRSMWAYFNAG